MNLKDLHRLSVLAIPPAPVDLVLLGYLDCPGGRGNQRPLRVLAAPWGQGFRGYPGCPIGLEGLVSLVLPGRHSEASLRYL